jgi:hypothetical protein
MITLSGLADLAPTKAQIEAKYGKGIDATQAVCYPASVKDANGNVLKRAEAYSLTYRDVSRSRKVWVHFNSKGIATDVEYLTDGKFTDVTQALALDTAPSRFCLSRSMTRLSRVSA